MKKRILKGVALVLAIILALPIINTSAWQTASAAAKPVLSSTKKTIVGTEATFTLNALNVSRKNVKKTVWYSKNEDVITVEATKDLLAGKVTTVGKGIADARCKITYKNGKSIFLSCRVTVKIPATAVSISNKKIAENGRHVIAVGEIYDFARSITPKNASDKTYWAIESLESGKQVATVNKQGIVTGLQPGLCRLKAVAAMTPNGVTSSIVNDSLTIEIVGKTVNVVKVNLIESNKLEIQFDKPINSSTIIGTGNKLLESIVIASMIDSKGVSATALGNLTGSLSTDGKTLTITAANSFNGTYGLRLSSSIKSTDNTALKAYNENLDFYDNSKPYFVNSTVDDTGLIAYINFSEPMNFSNLHITDARLESYSSTAAQATTIAMLNTKANYVKTADNKSLSIDLRTMPEVDRNKRFQISISGITDLSGNSPASLPVIAYLSTDTSQRAQAALINIERTGYNTLTATFSRAIQYSGYITLSNGAYINGVVDSTDPKKVNYTIPDSSAILSGTQEVSITGWNSYNVSYNDTTASTIHKRSVNFTLDNTLPVLTNSLLEVVNQNGVDSYILTLTYNKNVTLVNSNASLSAKIVKPDNTIYSDRILNYSGYSKDDKVTLILQSSQLTEEGVYTLSIPATFVRDTYGNANTATTVSVQKVVSVASKLSSPLSVQQDANDPNIINVYFDKKLDLVSAQTVSNYSLIGTGGTIASAEVTENTPTSAIVKLRLNPGCLPATTAYPFTISGIKGYQDSYSAMEKYSQTLYLKENAAPRISSVRFNSPYTIVITFDEVITGTPSFQVIQGSSDLYSSAIINGSILSVHLKSTPATNTTMTLVPNNNNKITDLSGNEIKMSTMSVPTY